MASSRKQSDTVDGRWVAAHVDDPGVRVVEVDVSPAAYHAGHVPGAILWDAYVDLRHPDYRPVAAHELQRLLSRSGITPETTVVFYGYGAPLGFWLLKAHGHGDVQILKGPRTQWTDAGGRWTTEAPRFEQSAYPLPSIDSTLLAFRTSLEAAHGQPDRLILDVRSVEEYSGERFWPSGAAEGAGRPGHIPGAVNVPIDALRREDGAPRPADEQAPLFEDAGVTKDKDVIVYCTIGNRASEAWFTLKRELAYPKVRVYYDSWVIWGREADTPIAQS